MHKEKPSLSCREGWRLIRRRSLINCYMNEMHEVNVCSRYLLWSRLGINFCRLEATSLLLSPVGDLHVTSMSGIILLCHRVCRCTRGSPASPVPLGTIFTPFRSYIRQAQCIARGTDFFSIQLALCPLWGCGGMLR